MCASALRDYGGQLGVKGVDVTLADGRTLKGAIVWKTPDGELTSEGRTVSDFVLDSALQRAAETLPDRTRFELDAKQWADLQVLLDAPPRDLPRLAKLLKKPSVFER